MGHATVQIEVDDVRVGPLAARVGALERRIEVIEEVRSADRLAFTVKEVAALIGTSPTTVYEKIGDGALCARNIGKRKLTILRDDLLSFLYSLPLAEQSYDWRHSDTDDTNGSDRDD
jgi:excisionase family DNA binding protein